MIVLLLVCCLAGISNTFPLANRMVDMTYIFDDTTVNFPSFKEFKIVELTERFGWQGVQMEEYSSAIHVGTHIDVPSHFIKGGLNADEIPLSQFISLAAVVDISSKAELDPDATLTVDDLLNWESTTGQNLNGTTILIRSGWGRKWNDSAAYFGTQENKTELHFPMMSVEAAQWLVENRNIKGVGTETLSLETGASQEFPVHNILLRHGLIGLESVANMDKLPIYGAKLYVLPMKIGKGSGAPTRIIATIPIIYGLPTSANEVPLSL